MDFYSKFFESKSRTVKGVGKEPRIHIWAIGIIATGMLIYFANFAVRPFYDCKKSGGTECTWHWLSNSSGTWGEFGDFVGGTINPFIGLLTVILLVRSLRQNEKALDQNQRALNLAQQQIEISLAEIKNSQLLYAANEKALTEQIAIAKQQHEIENKFLHSSRFFEYLSVVFYRPEIEVLRLEDRLIYRQCFPDNDLKIAQNVEKAVYEFVIDFYERLSELKPVNSDTISSFVTFTNYVNERLKGVLDSRMVVERKGIGAAKEYSIGDRKLHLYGGGIKTHFLNHIFQLRVLYKVCAFDYKFDEFNHCINLLDEAEAAFKHHLPEMAANADKQIEIVHGSIIPDWRKQIEPRFREFVTCYKGKFSVP